MKKHSNFHQSANNLGFTIVELMIATMVFAVILLLVTSGILQITRTYYKGVTSAKTQQTARAIVDQITQSIQFSGANVEPTPAPVPLTNQKFCIGEVKYSYRLNNQLKDGVNHALVSTSSPACTSSASVEPVDTNNVNGTELLSSNMRLTRFKVEGISGTNLYDVGITVVYGDDDLLVDSNGNKVGDPGFDYTTSKCTEIRGGQFCAVSSLSTTVQKRVNAL